MQLCKLKFVRGKHTASFISPFTYQKSRDIHFHRQFLVYFPNLKTERAERGKKETTKKPKKHNTLTCHIMDVVKPLVDERPVVIFSKSSCCMSHSMKQLISSYGANTTVYELDELSNGPDIDKALQKIGFKPTVPAIFIGQRFIGGAKEIISMQVQGRLVPVLKEARAIWV